MNKNLLILLFGVFLTLGLLSCQKIEDPTSVENNLQFETIGRTDSIPMKFGKFVGVSSDMPHVATLWFEDPDGTIVAIRLNATSGAMAPTVLRIPRK